MGEGVNASIPSWCITRACGFRALWKRHSASRCRPRSARSRDSRDFAWRPYIDHDPDIRTALCAIGRDFSTKGEGVYAS